MGTAHFPSGFSVLDDDDDDNNNNYYYTYLKGIWEYNWKRPVYDVISAIHSRYYSKQITRKFRTAQTSPNSVYSYIESSNP